MSVFGKVFGFKKAEDKITTGEAIQKLRETEEMLVKKQEYLESKIAKEIGIAKKNGVANKRVAIEALKRKKRYDNQLQQIDGTLSTIELQREALEGAHTNTAVLKTMSEAAKALKATHQNMDVNKVDEMMDDIAEQQELFREISDVISNPSAFRQDFDEDELERELEELEQEELDHVMLKIHPTPAIKLPQVQVPAAAPVAAKRYKEKSRPIEEDDDMKELAEWAS